MRVLGIETATAVCGAAVAVDGAVTDEVWLEEKYVHAEKLLTLIHRVLGSAGITSAQLDAVAVSIGPGSFTGLRIGLSAAKGLVYAVERPLVAVSTLEALAFRAARSGAVGAAENILAVLDARRDEVYAQLFTVTDGCPVPVWEPRASALPALVGDLGGGSVVVTGDVAGKLVAFLSSHSAGRAERVRMAPAEVARCSAGSVAVLGTTLLARGEVENPVSLEPRYIKEFFLGTR